MTTGNDLEILSWQIYILHVQNSVPETCKATDEMTLQQYDKQIPKVKSH